MSIGNHRQCSWAGLPSSGGLTEREADMCTVAASPRECASPVTHGPSPGSQRETGDHSGTCRRDISGDALRATQQAHTSHVKKPHPQPPWFLCAEH